MISTAQTWRIAAIIGIVLASAAILASLATVGLGGSTRSYAHQSPGDCFSNALTLAFARTPATTVQGGTIEYRVLAQNNISADPSACDITGADTEISEAVKQIRPAAWPCPASDVVKISRLRYDRS